MVPDQLPAASCPSLFTARVMPQDLLYTPPGYIYIEKTLDAHAISIRCSSFIITRRSMKNMLMALSCMPPHNVTKLITDTVEAMPELAPSAEEVEDEIDEDEVALFILYS